VRLTRRVVQRREPEGPRRAHVDFPIVQGLDEVVLVVPGRDVDGRVAHYVPLVHETLAEARLGSEMSVVVFEDVYTWVGRVSRDEMDHGTRGMKDEIENERERVTTYLLHRVPLLYAILSTRAGLLSVPTPLPQGASFAC
jgi:hypothetical protein